MNLEGKWKAIILGGLITGLAPFIPFVKLVCCLPPIIGAFVAVAIYRGGSQPPPSITSNDGVVLGAMSGIIGTGIYGVLILPLVYVASLFGGFLDGIIPQLTDIPQNIRPLIEGILANLGSFVGLIIMMQIVTQLAISLVMGMIGGLIGVALLKPKPAPE